jgi:diguanylate cyclase (GGDEF)-like protein
MEESNGGEKRYLPRNADESQLYYWRPQVEALVATALLNPDQRNAAIDKLSRVIADLEQNAIRDPLTGLLNRGTGMLMLSSEVKQARKSKLPLSLIFLDLDHFKLINDRLGHAAGDRALGGTGSKLAGLAPDYAIMFRYGGEEIAVALPDTNKTEAIVLANNIGVGLRESLARDASLDPASIDSVTVSCGIAELGEVGGDEDFRSLMDRADRLMYQSKQAGRDRLSYLGQDGQIETWSYKRNR